MYINKKSVSKEYHKLIDFDLLLNQLKEEEMKNKDFEHTIKHNEDVNIKLNLTYDVHKTKGYAWDITNINNLF